MKKILFLFLSSPLFGWTILTGDLKGWNTNNLSIGLNTANCTLSESEMHAIVDEAIAAWNGIPTADLVLSRRDSTTTADEIANDTSVDPPVIACDTNLSAHVNGATYIPGLTQFPGFDADGHINQTGMLLNAENGLLAEISNLTHNQLVIVVAHELGHALGLGHSQDPQALMYFDISGKTEAVITEDDMDGIAFLYPRDELSGKPFGCAAAHKPGPVPIKWMTFSAIMTVLIAFGTILFGRKFLNSEQLP